SLFSCRSRPEFDRSIMAARNQLLDYVAPTDRGHCARVTAKCRSLFSVIAAPDADRLIVAACPQLLAIDRPADAKNSMVVPSKCQFDSPVEGVPDLASMIVADRSEPGSIWMPGDPVHPISVAFEDLGMFWIVQIPNADDGVHTCRGNSIFAGVP